MDPHSQHDNNGDGGDAYEAASDDDVDECIKVGFFVSGDVGFFPGYLVCGADLWNVDHTKRVEMTKLFCIFSKPFDQVCQYSATLSLLCAFTSHGSDKEHSLWKISVNVIDFNPSQIRI